ncbi:hypothetical protein NDU88_006587 [Pleurodeles waltl]|uniref:Uncharacterized protein n=1 Tax=Pleurodeles waltl TaxID=8319 RepID=A0AAV7X1Z9_PLEWA|nr:hypothetical protein NDU88_006587 [Pleurodeles waltl]
MDNNPALEPFTVSEAPPTQAARWKAWIERLQAYLEALDIRDECKRPLVLHLGGADIHKISKSVIEAAPHTYTTLNDAISAHFKPYANPDYELFLLCQVHQKTEESVDVFYACLKELASICTLPDEEDEVRTQFIQGCTSSMLHEHTLQEPNMRMKDILTFGCSQELSKARAATMEQATPVQVKTEPVNAVVTRSPKNKDMQRGARQRDRQCRWCGCSLPHPWGCPAHGKICSACGKINHFAKVTLQNQPVPALIDTGASINLMAAEVYHSLPTRLQLRPTSVLVYAFGNAQPLQIMGTFTVEVGHEGTDSPQKYICLKKGLVSC